MKLIIKHILCTFIFLFGCIAVDAQQSTSVPEKAETTQNDTLVRKKDSLILKLDQQKYRSNNIVFLLDISNSMAKENKMPLLRQSMEVLLIRLRKIDKVHLLTFGNAVNLLYSTSAITGPDSLSRILKTVRSIASATNVNGGLQVAYETALSNFISQSNNEIMLVTDGEFVLNRYTIELVRLNPQVRLTAVVVGDEGMVKKAAEYIQLTLHLPVVSLVTEKSDLQELLNHIKKNAEK